MKTLVHFGAGNIGRSLVGQLFSRAGWNVVFIDTVPEIIEALNKKGRYLVRIKDEYCVDLWVDKVSGVLVSERARVKKELIKADLISTAVGPNVLPKIFPILAEAIKERTAPVSIILCENLHHIKEIVEIGIKELLPKNLEFKKKVGIVATSIGKMVPIMPEVIRERDPLEVWAEAYNQIIADREGFVGNIPEIEGLALKSNFEAYVERKLFIHNLGHAACAYFGFGAGKRLIWESVADKEIFEKTKAVMWESANALIRKFPREFNSQNQEQHINDLLKRFANKALGDTVYRVGRDLKRKLSADDRCLGAIKLILSQKIFPKLTCEVVAAGMCFKATDPQGQMYPGDIEFHKILKEQGPLMILEKISGLDQTNDRLIIKTIIEGYNHYKNL